MTPDFGVADRVGRVIHLLRQGEAASARALASELGVSVRTVQRYLLALERQGLVERRPRKGAGPGRSILWIWKGAEDDADRS